MDKEQIEAKMAGYETELQKVTLLAYRLEGAIAALRDLLEPIAPEPPKDE